MTKKPKCVICDKRPANGGGYCVQCADGVTRERKARTSDQPRNFLHYRGHVVGLYPDGDKTLKARLLKRSLKGLPKRKTVDLDHYCNGYSREVVKRFKACILTLVNA